MLILFAGCASAPQSDSPIPKRQIQFVETDRPNCVVDLFFPLPNERVTWSGECSNGRVAGRGKLVSTSGTELEGEFRGGAPFDAEGHISTPRKDGQRVMIGAKFTAGRGDFFKLPQQPRVAQSYGQKLESAFKQFIVYTDKVDKTAPPAVAEVEVEAEPDGKVKTFRLSESSGNKKWDDAVLQAASKVNRLPSDIDGKVPPRLMIRFRQF